MTKFDSLEALEAFFAAEKAAILSLDNERKASEAAANLWAAAAIKAWYERETAPIARMRDEALAECEGKTASKTAGKTAGKTAKTASADHVKLARARARSTWYNAKLRGHVSADFDTWYTAERAIAFEARALETTSSLTFASA